MTYETRKLSEIKLPVYFSFVALPGFDLSLLNSYGFGGEYSFFSGKKDLTTDTLPFLTWQADNDNQTLESKRIQL